MMTLSKKNWIYFLMGGFLTLVIAIGIGSAFAQTGDNEATPTPETEDAPAETAPDTDTDTPGLGRSSSFGSEALAAALGITVEELDAAKQTAREAAIAQAVADGELTQEQADELLANGFGGRGFHFGSDQSTYLAEALGITVEELEDARDQVYADQLAAMVEAGRITQEQADMALAQRAVQDYVDTDALEATVRSVYEDAVAQALAAGVITQEQADQLLTQLSEQSFGFRGFGFGDGPGRGGHHGFGGGGRGFGRGFGNGAAPTTPDTDAAPSTETGSDL